MNFRDNYELYRDLNGDDLEKWRATLVAIEAEIAHHTDIRDKAKREAKKRVRQDAVSDVLWAARWVFDDIVGLLEHRRRQVAEEVACLEAERLADSIAGNAAA